MAAVTICSDFGAPKNKVSHCFHCFPIYLPWSGGTRCHDLSFLNIELRANFFTMTFYFILSSMYSLLQFSSILFCCHCCSQCNCWHLGYWLHLVKKKKKKREKEKEVSRSSLSCWYVVVDNFFIWKVVRVLITS